MSTGDSRRTAPQKSTTPAAAGDTDATPTEGPVGGVLPVKKAVRKATNGAGGSSTGASKTTPAKTTPAKSAPAKSTAAKKAGGAKGAGSGGRGTPSSGGRGTTSDVLDSGSVFGRKSSPARPQGRPNSKKGGRLATPVKVAERRNWGPILLYGATGLVALLIIGYGVYPVIRDAMKGPWQEQVAGIPGLIDYRDPASPDYSQASMLQNHEAGDLSYEVTPPVGGNHNSYWQRCMGDVYTSQIADEHAVHSLEHGAVWVTYNPDLPQDQIDKLADRIRDREYTLMSPYPGLDPPISLQAWGYQLKVDNADDGRIGDFINALARNATMEPDATCGGGITDASPTPLDLDGGM